MRGARSRGARAQLRAAIAGHRPTRDAYAPDSTNEHATELGRAARHSHTRPSAGEPDVRPSPTQAYPTPLARYVTELGRVASHFYVKAPSIVTFNERLKPHLREEDVLAMMALSSEFDSMAVR